MNTISRPRIAALLGAMLSTAAFAAPQAFVHSDGADGNTRHGCEQSRPCRTFAAAITVVDNGGEIVALDAADFGAVAITKSVTLLGNSQASIVATSGQAVTIATPGVHVVLRGLDIRGAGGSSGVVMTSGASLAVEKSVIANFPLAGVSVSTPATVRVVDSMVSGNSTGLFLSGGARADVAKSFFMRNSSGGVSVNAASATTSASITDCVASGGLHGFSVSGDATAQGRLAITRSTASHNVRGFVASIGGVLGLAYSMASGNEVGLANIPGVVGFPPGVFETFGNNVVTQNTAATLGIITPAPLM